MPMRIRALAPADLPHVAAIYAAEVETGLASWEWHAPSLAEMTARAKAVQEKHWPYFVAEGSAGEILGFAYAQPFRARRAYDWTAEHSVYVAPTGRRCGVGRALMEALIDACTVRDARHMLAVIGDPEPRRSIAFHRALGFAEVGKIPGLGFKFGEWLDWTLMHRALGEGSATPPRDCA